MKIYLAATYSRYPEMQGVAEKLRGLGWEVTSNWITGIPYKDPSQDAMKDIDDILNADTLLFFSGGVGSKGGRHTEFGFAYAMQKTIIIIGERENVFHSLPGVVIVDDLETAIVWLGDLPKEVKLMCTHAGVVSGEECPYCKSTG